MVSDEAGEALDAIKIKGGFKSLDNAMDHLLQNLHKPQVVT